MIAATLGAWSVLCAFLAQVQFPHFLIICESVESIYGGLADDEVVYHVMQAMVGVVWAIGVLGLILYVAIASRYRRASTRASS
ncbi:hypothetical protein SAMN05192544_1025131 [Paraburkholderia hospita]|nr:hypothetical protein SAMN05192544_1025131 [Paraburkholderia hospita]